MEHPTVGPPSQFSDFNIFIPKTIMFTKTVDRAKRSVIRQLGTL